MPRPPPPERPVAVVSSQLLSTSQGERRMRPRSTLSAALRVALVLLFLVGLTASYAASGPAPGGRRVTEMPMHVQTEGITYADYRAHQAALLSRLVGSVPASAMHPALRLELSRAEIDGVEKAPRVSGTPLSIGLVKGVSPRFLLDGLR